MLFNFSCSIAEQNITIFIHGTVQSLLFFINPAKNLGPFYYKDSYYLDALNYCRFNSWMIDDQPMHDLGLVEISKQQILAYRQGLLLNSENRSKGIYPIAEAYDTLNLLTNNVENDFYTFGWLGALNSFHRRKSGFEFYLSLCDLLQTKYKDQDVRVNIIAHSHGGNLALYLAEAEELYKLGLKVESLVMFGAPIQPETIKFITSDVFKNIINFYSDADVVQKIDIFSTHSWMSKRKFSDLMDLSKFKHDSKRIVDARILIENNSVLGHDCLGWLNKFTSKNETISFLEPFPLMSYTALLTKNIYLLEPGYLNLDINIIKTEEDLQVRLYNKLGLVKTDQYEESPFLILKNRISNYWKPYACSSNLGKLFIGIKSLIKVIFKEKNYCLAV